MPPTLKEYFFVDKAVKLFEIVKKVGGLRAFVKQRYLMDVNRIGDLVGEDQFGNRYFEDNTYFVPRNRYVVFAERVWLDYDASQVPPEWHRWLHHICDKPPTIEPPAERRKWMMEHLPNKSLEMSQKYVPYSTTRPKVEGWMPGGRKKTDDTF